MTPNNSPELTSRELTVLSLLAHGNRTSEIAKRLRLDYKTVARICQDVKAKLRADSLADLAAWAEDNLPRG